MDNLAAGIEPTEDELAADWYAVAREDVTEEMREEYRTMCEREAGRDLDVLIAPHSR